MGIGGLGGIGGQGKACGLGEVGALEVVGRVLLCSLRDIYYLETRAPRIEFDVSSESRSHFTIIFLGV